MSKKSNRKRIAELSTRVRQLESAITILVSAKDGVSASPWPPAKSLAKVKLPVSPKTTAAKKPASKKSAPAPTTPAKTAEKASAKKAGAKQTPTLVDALKYVLKQHQEAKSGPVKAVQLYGEVHQAGYRFAGKNHKNNMNYTYRLLRTNKAFKKADDGAYALA